MQAQILKLLNCTVADHDIGVILITHNLGVVAQTCTDVAVMYAGNVVESGPVARVIEDPANPYTRVLMAAITTNESRRGSLNGLGGHGTQPDRPVTGMPLFAALPAGAARLYSRGAALGCCRARPLDSLPPGKGKRKGSPMSEPILRIEDISKVYGARRSLFGHASEVQALKDVSIAVNKGESFGLVGESGSGKTTLTRSILLLEPRHPGASCSKGAPWRNHRRSSCAACGRGFRSCSRTHAPRSTRACRCRIS